MTTSEFTPMPAAGAGSRPTVKQLAVGLLLVLTIEAEAGGGKLLGTPGVMQIEGAGGGGLVPWATLAGYAADDEWAVTVFGSQASVEDFRLRVQGVALNLRDQVELSLARQDFDLRGSGSEIAQDIVGLKWHAYGDVVYGASPQWSLGLQHKRLRDPAIAEAVGADNPDQGTDFYLSASKLHLGTPFGYNLLWTLNSRATRANQLGLLGFGGDREDRYRLQLEASLALLPHPNWALGLEYRMKPDNLAFAREDDWKDLFVVYLPNKSLAITAAWVDLGEVAGAGEQSGFYTSLTGYFW